MTNIITNKATVTTDVNGAMCHSLPENNKMYSNTPLEEALINQVDKNSTKEYQTRIKLMLWCGAKYLTA